MGADDAADGVMSIMIYIFKKGRWQDGEYTIGCAAWETNPISTQEQESVTEYAVD